MSTHFIFPKPRDWSTFEDIVCDVFARKYQNPNLQRYGRNGQRQNGVDIAGLTSQGMLGVQCKHHIKGDIATDEIDDEVTASGKFRPGLVEYIITTSADRDTKAHDYVHELATARAATGDYPVTIKFWEDICNWLSEYPDLVYKHFTKFFPVRELEHIPLASFRQQPKTAIRWPCTKDALIHQTSAALGAVAKVDPYMLSVGFTTFDTASFSESVDVEVRIANLLQSDDAEQGFMRAADILKQLHSVLSDPYFSKTVFLQIQARLSYAFLFGWMFRKVSNYRLQIIAGEEVWPSDGLIPTPSLLSDDLPVLHDSSSTEVVLIFNISRHIQRLVMDYVATWSQQPKAILSYRLDGGRIGSASQAMSLAFEISRKIKNLNDNWEVRKVHLFGAVPAALAVLIGHHLNAICPIDLYYADEARSTYKLGGTLHNGL